MKMAMMPITTSNSMSVKAGVRRWSLILLFKGASLGPSPTD